MTSQTPHNPDDFFSSEFSSGPPARPGSATLPRQRRAPPPPPPKQTTTAAARPTAGATSSSLSSAKPAPRPRPSAPSRPSAGSTSSTVRARPAFGSNRAVGATSTTTTTGTSATSGIGQRKASSMSRPVGNYYSSGGVTTTQAPVATTASSSDWDWGTQTKADTTDWSNPSGGTSQDPTGATSTATSDKDWYSGTSVSSSNAHVVASAAPSPYATPGFANGGSSSAAGNTSSSYSSFNPSIQHNQQQPMQAGTGFYQHPSQAPREQQHSLLSGVMDSGAMNTGESSAGGISSAPAYSMFVPKPQSTDSMMDSSYLPMDEAPLLEELGVNTDHILLKTKAVVLPFSRFGGNALEPEVICKDADLAGPIAFALLLGAEMIFSGKLQFGYIYGFGLFGCIAMTFVVNLVAPHNPISFWTVTSILGYSLLPVNLLALIKIFVINLINLQTLGRLLGIVTVAWSTTASTRLFELGCQLRSQRYLIAYPIALLYSAFVLITIF